MRAISEIIIHCSATIEGMNYHAADIKAWHINRGFSDIGYHYVIDLDGTIEDGRDISIIGAHCKGHNQNSIGICYIGGLDKNGNPKDTRTDSQKVSLTNLVKLLQTIYKVPVYGHRDFNTKKACPCFDAQKEFPTLT